MGEYHAGVAVEGVEDLHAEAGVLAGHVELKSLPFCGGGVEQDELAGEEGLVESVGAGHGDGGGGREEEFVHVLGSGLVNCDGTMLHALKDSPV